MVLTRKNRKQHPFRTVFEAFYFVCLNIARLSDASFIILVVLFETSKKMPLPLHRRKEKTSRQEIRNINNNK